MWSTIWHKCDHQNQTVQSIFYLHQLFSSISNIHLFFAGWWRMSKPLGGTPSSACGCGLKLQDGVAPRCWSTSPLCQVTNGKLSCSVFLCTACSCWCVNKVRLWFGSYGNCSLSVLGEVPCVFDFKAVQLSCVDWCSMSVHQNVALVRTVA